ncbi:MAG: maleylpyruvate isomerase family mycothiol-dependent enzyme [Actinomycetota bacterium]|nr:maleylpyruvate isomerase family mycothiol-dependent enzyme [Actinomycetota bacterium]
MDLKTLYAQAQDRTIAMVGALPPDTLRRAVPATPGWTVADVVCHLCGVATDMSLGNVEGAATPPWTARQVAERRGRSIDEVLVEWHECTPTLLGMLAQPGRVDASAFDLLTHEHDLRGALGLAGPSDAEAVEVVTSRLAQRLSRVVEGAGLPTLHLVADGIEWVCGPGDAAATASASTMEWFRAMMGRRSVGQVLTYGWHGEGDPSIYLAVLSLFGALPEQAVAEAGAPTESTSVL